MKPCSALSTHYSAFIDGELTPLESVAIRKHIQRCSKCRHDVQELENMKLAVHMHGTSSPIRPELKKKLEGTLKALERRRKQRVQGSLLAAAAAAAIIVVIGSPTKSISLQSTERDSIESAESITPIAQLSPREHDTTKTKTLDETVFSNLIKRHLGLNNPTPHASEALLSFEALPVQFLEGGTQVRQVLNASYQRCLQTRSGASLAVLDATQLQLPPQVEASLDRIGVYVEQRDTVELRVSQSGQRFFVLLTDKAHRLGDVI